MDWQTLINVAGGALLSAIGWWCRQIWDSIEKLKEDVNNIEVTLPTSYVTKNEIAVRFDRIEFLLDKLYEKLEQKQDRRITDK